MSGPQLLFVDNLDADTYARLLAAPMDKTRIFVVSKSGGTAETMMQLGGAVLALQRDGLAPASHIAGIAGAGDNALCRLAATYGFPLLPHDEAIGGRFSVLSNVGLLPAQWAEGLSPTSRAGRGRAGDAGHGYG